MLGGAVAAILGLAGSLFIQRRRVWVRAVRGAD
ncbi:cytochrome c biogenesis protein ResB, partial [Streptomyces sp900105245]